MNERTLSRRAGFTLLEIMLVIVIIGVIAAIAIGNLDVVGTSNQAKRTAATTQIGQISTAVQRFYMDTGKMPSTLDGLVSNPGQNGWKGPYLKKLKPDPWGETFTYTSSGSNYEIKTNAGGSEGGPISSNDL
jgi:general secretion pathway protein G